MGSPNPTLYLDFDGVLHPGHAQANERFSRQEHLVAVLDSLEVDIVISSSWRFQYTQAKLRTVLHPVIGERIVGITGDPVVGAYSRWREIERHAMWNAVKDFRALDDSTFLFPPDCGALIACNGATGMGSREAEVIRRWLKG